MKKSFLLIIGLIGSVSLCASGQQNQASVRDIPAYNAIMRAQIGFTRPAADQPNQVNRSLITEFNAVSDQANPVTNCAVAVQPGQTLAQAHVVAQGAGLPVLPSTHVNNIS